MPRVSPKTFSVASWLRLWCLHFLAEQGPMNGADLREKIEGALEQHGIVKRELRRKRHVVTEGWSFSNNLLYKLVLGSLETEHYAIARDENPEKVDRHWNPTLYQITDIGRAHIQELREELTKQFALSSALMEVTLANMKEDNSTEDQNRVNI